MKDLEDDEREFPIRVYTKVETCIYKSRVGSALCTPFVCECRPQ